MQKKTLLISLVGHQPLPNLMAIKHYQPDYIIFISSGEPMSEKRKTNLINLLPKDTKSVDIRKPVSAWDIRSIPAHLPKWLKRHKLNDVDIICDLTGGTKAMSLGLAESARLLEQDLCMIYLESGNYQTNLYKYIFNEDGSIILDPQTPTTISLLLSIDDFLMAYMGEFDTSPYCESEEGKAKIEAQRRQLKNDPNGLKGFEGGICFEEDVYNGFKSLNIDNLKIKYSIRPNKAEEIDIILGYNNRFALIECKTGKKSGKVDGILQLNSLANDRHLGIYTQKILAISRNLSDDKERTNLYKMTQDHGIHLLEFPLWSFEDRKRDANGRIHWEEHELDEFRTVLKKVFGI